MIFDDRRCELGEGAIWHPLRKQLFWFDILNRRLMTRTAEGPLAWCFDEFVSAAGWIGTMSKLGDGGPGQGAIYRWFKGELRKLFDGLTIPNSIWFSRDGRIAFFSDTLTHKVMRVALDENGWPTGPTEIFLDLSSEGLLPDGATVDADGVLWLAQWGMGRVAAYDPQGQLLRTVPVAGPHSSCPALGGANMRTLHVTTALEHMSQADRTAWPDAGKVFAISGVATGIPEPQVLL